ncbi:IS66 family transposase, partial [Escherichia coli]|nr:IS66 family transposase [Escherichia coli]
APSRPIERGIAGPGLLARVLTGKYCEHLPLYRQSEIFARQGIELSRALLSNWVDACCQLMTPLNDTLYRYVMNTRKVHTDDTPVKVLAPGRKKAKTGRIWTYVRDDRNAGSSEPPAVWFAYSPDRQGKHPVQHLRPFRGILQADAFSGYDRLFSAEREGGALTEVACWAHARRGFADLYKISKDPRAAIAVKKIAGLYRLEKKISSRPVEKIRQWRQRYARPILEDLWSWLEEQEPQCSPGRALHKAIVYALSHRVELSRFLEDGAVPLDNNVCERAIKNVVLGRKSWLFAGSQMAGERAAQIMSLLETAKRNGLEPHAWLTDVLMRLPEWPEERLAELLPLEGFTFSG